MIACVEGKILEKESGSLVVFCGGVGYRLFVSYQTYSKVKEGESRFFYTHHFVKEDRNELYGFLDKREMSLFAKLIGIGGIGPKTALAILSPFESIKVEKAITEGNADFLTKIPGIGKKTAQRIILELKGKIEEKEEKVSVPDEVFQILLNLGYKQKEIEKVILQISKEGGDLRDLDSVLKKCFEKLSPI